MSKPKVSYHEFAAQQVKEGTVAWFIERRIAESKKPGARPILPSHYYTLLRIKKAPIGQKVAAALVPLDLIDHGRMRKAQFTHMGTPVKPQTVRQDFTYLRSLIRTFVDLDELPETALNVFRKANRLLTREQLVGKSKPRERRLEPDEEVRIFAAVDSMRCKIPLRALVEFSLLTGRRVGESCRLKWTDLDDTKRTCLVRDLKNSAGKGFHGEFPLLGRAWDIVQAQPRVTEFIFSMQRKKNAPWRQVSSKTVTAAYIRVKKKCGLHGADLRLHDNRAETFSRLFEDGYSVPEVQQVSLHKGDAKTLLVHYTRLRPESLHAGPASKRQ
jgi:integrase